MFNPYKKITAVLQGHGLFLGQAQLPSNKQRPQEFAAPGQERYAAFHLPRKSDIRAGNDATPEVGVRNDFTQVDHVPEQ